MKGHQPFLGSKEAQGLFWDLVLLHDGSRLTKMAKFPKDTWFPSDQLLKKYAGCLHARQLVFLHRVDLISAQLNTFRYYLIPSPSKCSRRETLLPS